MIRRSMAILAWLVAGHLVLGGLFWALLQTPESNVFMLTVSAVLVLLMVVWIGLVTGVGLRGWRHTGPVIGLFGGVARRVAWIVPALLVFWVIWWLTDAGLDYFAAHAGEIDAWFIANAGWVGTTWLHAALRWVLYAVRFAVGLSLALALFAAGLGLGPGRVASLTWVRRGLSWRTLAVVGGAVLLMWAGPWQLAYWRPSGLPATWAQPAFAAVKLGVLFVLANALWAAALWAVGREPKQKPAAADAVPAPAPAAEPQL